MHGVLSVIDLVFGSRPSPFRPVPDSRDCEHAERWLDGVLEGAILSMTMQSHAFERHSGKVVRMDTRIAIQPSEDGSNLTVQMDSHPHGSSVSTDECHCTIRPLGMNYLPALEHVLYERAGFHIPSGGHPTAKTYTFCMTIQDMNLSVTVVLDTSGRGFLTFLVTD